MTRRETDRQAIDDLICAYRADQTQESFCVLFEALHGFFDVYEPHESEEGPNTNGDHFLLCRRLVKAFGVEGFDPNSAESDELYDHAANEVYLAMEEELEEIWERPVLGEGADSALPEGGFLAVDLAQRKVLYHPTQPIRADWSQPIRREAPKVGRNDPCPCGSGRKFKKCHLGREVAFGRDLRGNLVPPAAGDMTAGVANV